LLVSASRRPYKQNGNSLTVLNCVFAVGCGGIIQKQTREPMFLINVSREKNVCLNFKIEYYLTIITRETKEKGLINNII